MSSCLKLNCCSPRRRETASRLTKSRPSSESSSSPSRSPPDAHLDERLPPEDLPHDRRVEQHAALGRRQRIEARGDDRPDARRQIVGAIASPLEHGRGELLDEERVPFRRPDDCRRLEAGVGKQALGQLVRLLLPEGVERQRRVARQPTTPGRLSLQQLRAREGEDARAAHPAGARRAPRAGRACPRRPSGRPRRRAMSAAVARAPRSGGAPSRRAPLARPRSPRSPARSGCRRAPPPGRSRHCRPARPSCPPASSRPPPSGRCRRCGRSA